MPNAEVLVLHGSPGSGKSTLARALFEQLRVAEQSVAVIDPDELNLVHPDQGRAFWQGNLQAIWPNYTAMGDVRAIVPTVIADAEDHRRLRVALPASRFIICELVAPVAILKDRVWAREPNEHWKRELEKWIDVYHQRDENQKFGDFQVATHDKPVDWFVQGLSASYPEPRGLVVQLPPPRTRPERPTAQARLAGPAVSR